MPWDFALILLVLAVVVPWCGRVRVRRLMAQPVVTPMERLSLYATTIAFQWLAVAIVGWRALARGMSPVALGLPITDPGSTATVTIVLTAILMAVQLLGLRHTARLPPDKRGFVQHLATKVLPQNTVERLAFAAVATTVGVCEEFLYRGFVFSSLSGLPAVSLAGLILIPSGWTLGFLGSALLFALAHLYQGPKGMVTTLVAGLLFAGARAFTGNLAPSVVAHAAVDLTAGLLAPKLLRPSPE